MKAEQIEARLQQFTGTETWWQHPLFKSFTYTDGVKFVADECKAYWLIDAILSWQTNVAVRKEEFQVWILAKQPNGEWILSCEDGDNDSVCEQVIQFSDFPLNKITIWLANGVLHLPSEY